MKIIKVEYYLRKVVAVRSLEKYLINSFNSRVIYGVAISQGKGRGIEIRLWDVLGNEEINSEVAEIDCVEGHYCFKFENNNLEIL